MSNSVGDWVRLVDADKTELGINLSDSEIQGVSKNAFHSFVKKKVKINMLKIFSELKKKHSKSKFLSCAELKPADYILDSRFTTKEKQLLFKLRSKTLDVKDNFKGLNNNPWCISCGLFTETQGHLLQCPQLVVGLKYPDLKTSRLNENFIYGNMTQQQMIVTIYSEVLEIREKFTQTLEIDEE